MSLEVELQGPVEERPVTAWDISQTRLMSERLEKAINELFKVWADDLTDDQRARAVAASNVLNDAFRTIVSALPPCDDRSAALRKIREAYNDCMSAVIHKGNF